jgi:pyruvate,water dikinase
VPLSRSSIVAREFGIPAVMGTGVATRRIRSGQTITVDGDAERLVIWYHEPALVENARLQCIPPREIEPLH